MLALRSVAAAVLTWVACLTLGANPVFAQVSYSGIDRATVRVVALGQVDVEVVEHEKKRLRFAVPLAGHGSGVVVDGSGLILTAAHVVDGARVVAVMIPGEMGALPAKVVYEDPTRDVALLRVAGRLKHVATLAAEGEPLAVRQTVYAVGYPLDARRADPQSTQGAVSGIKADGELQLSMSVNPGNSGGPIIDAEERVRGIVVKRGNVKAGVIGIALAVPNRAYLAAIERERARSLAPAARALLSSLSQQRLADLALFMAQNGLEVIEESLSSDPEELDAGAAAKLRVASEGAEATADGKLVAAGFYWNRHVALAYHGKPEAEAMRLKAIRLARSAVRLEPKLRASPFAKMILSEPGATRRPAGADRESARPMGFPRGLGGYGHLHAGIANWDIQQPRPDSDESTSEGGFTWGFGAGVEWRHSRNVRLRGGGEASLSHLKHLGRTTGLRAGLSIWVFELSGGFGNAEVVDERATTNGRYYQIGFSWEPQIMESEGMDLRAALGYQMRFFSFGDPDSDQSSAGVYAGLAGALGP